MPLRRAIGISLACLVTSACATGITSEAGIAPDGVTSEAGVTPDGITSEASRPHQPADTAGLAAQSAEVPIDRSDGSPCARARKSRATEDRFLTDACGSISNRRGGSSRAAGSSQFGKGVWYDHVGRPTASGEVLDTVTATAAHRSLPLAS